MTPEGLAWVDARLSRRRARSRPGWVRQHKFTKHLGDGGFRRADKGRVPGDAQRCECACNEGRGSSGAGSIAWGNARAREGTDPRVGSYGDAAREIVWLEEHHPFAAGKADEWRRIAPEQHHGRHLLVDRGHDFSAHELTVFLRGCRPDLVDDDVDAERPPRQRPRTVDPLADDLRGRAADTENTETARLRDR